MKFLKEAFIKFKNKNFAGFWNTKNKGIVILVPTIILSGLILIVSVGLSQILIRELEFSADLLFSEKAYFSAESGIETSLLSLKNEPLNTVNVSDIAVGEGAYYDLQINNSVKGFLFSLNPNETIKFRLGIDTDQYFGTSISPVLGIELSPKSEEIQWKILCQNSENKTISLQERGDKFPSGKYDDGVNSLSNMNLNSFFATNNGKTCFMSISNLGLAKIFGEIRAQGLMSPAKTQIIATGKSFSREKTVTFQYLQKNISSLFDLGLYFTGE